MWSEKPGVYMDVERTSGMVSNAPHNPADVPTDVEVDEPTLPYSRAKIDRLRHGARPRPQEQRVDAERPDITHLSTRGPLTVVSEHADEIAHDQSMQGWFGSDGRWVRICLDSFAHFGFSGAPPGMIGAVDASFLSGTIGDEGSTSLVPGPQRLEQLTAPQPIVRRHEWKLAVLVASALALALAAWVLTRNDVGTRQAMTGDAQQVRSDVPSQSSDRPSEAPSEIPIELPIEKPSEESVDPASETEIAAHEQTHAKPKPRKDIGACDKHRKLAADAKAGGDWARLLELAQRRSCWSRASAVALQMEALFELGRYHECFALGSKYAEKKEIQTWRSTCQLNL